MNKKMMRLLFELLKDSKRSDRELARVLEVSQATVTRMRNKLVRDGFIQQFTIIPDLTKIGFEILAVTTFKSKMRKELKERASKWTVSRPNVLFAARAQGMGKNAVMLSIHRNYTDYSNFLSDVLFLGGEDIEDHETLLISLKGFIAKHFSLKYIAELSENL